MQVKKYIYNSSNVSFNQEMSNYYSKFRYKINKNLFLFQFEFI